MATLLISFSYQPAVLQCFCCLSPSRKRGSRNNYTNLMPHCSLSPEQIEVEKRKYECPMGIRTHYKSLLSALVPCELSQTYRIDILINILDNNNHRTKIKEHPRYFCKSERKWNLYCINVNDNSHLSFRNLITNSRFFPQKNMESLKHLCIKGFAYLTWKTI